MACSHASHLQFARGMQRRATHDGRPTPGHGAPSSARFPAAELALGLLAGTPSGPLAFSAAAEKPPLPMGVLQPAAAGHRHRHPCCACCPATRPSGPQELQPRQVLSRLEAKLGKPVDQIREEVRGLLGEGS